jgi:hypothetical protein
MWLAVLSDQLRVVALVSRYLTNKLIRNRLLPECIAALRTLPCDKVISSGITFPFGKLSQAPGHISDSLLTRPPLCIATPFDLHVLATPPAFRLSQDQTLQLNFMARIVPDAHRHPFELR